MRSPATQFSSRSALCDGVAKLDLNSMERLHYERRAQFYMNLNRLEYFIR
jgi:hypothetical protein